MVRKIGEAAKKVAEFYLLGIALTFAITLLVGATGAHYVETFSFAILGWPTAALVMVAKSRAVKIHAEARHQNRY